MNLTCEYKRVQSDLSQLLSKKIDIPDNNLIESLEKPISKIEKYDSALLKHSIAVSLISAFIGKCLDLSPDEIDELYIAGALHDIGKIYIPKSIINKPGSLDEDERKVIEAHPAYSIWHLVNNSNKQYYSHKVLDMIRYHHEEVSGHGYPYGLKRSQINTGAKILAIADKLEAYGAKRSYHEARTLEQCLEFIQLQIEEKVIDDKIATTVLRMLSTEKKISS